MRSKKYTPTGAFSFLMMGAVALILSACGTHRNNDYGYADGIYESENATADNGGQANSNYYKQYFKSKEGTYENLPEEDLIFTDIEAYSTTETLDDNGYVVFEENEYGDEGYGPWGSNSENVTINIYGGYGYGWYGWHRPYWYGYWGYPFYYPPYWGISWGWYYPYYYYGYYGYYGYHYYPYYAYSGYYGGYYNGVAYNRGRRNLDYTNGRAAYSRRGVNSRSSYSRSETSRRQNTSVRRSTQFDSRGRPAVNTRSNRAVKPRSTPRINNNRSNNVRRSTRPNVNRSTRPSVNRSSTRRNSGSFRSSGSTRSSGSRSGGRRGRG